jgi:hypothetical protein
MSNLLFNRANNEGIPVIICPMNKVNALRSPFKWPMQFDLDGLAQFARNNQMLLVFMQVPIFSILAKLDRMPTIRSLETRKAYLFTQLFENKISFEGFRESISQHLYGGGGNIFTATSFKLCSRTCHLFPFRLCLLILSFRGTFEALL